MKHKAVWALVVILALATSAAAQVQEEQVGNFNLRKVKDQMTDADRSSAMVKADSGAVKGLMWKCMDDGLNVVFVWNKYLMGDSSTQSITVQSRFSSEQMVADRWDMGVGRQAGFLPKYRVKSFTAKALVDSSVTLRVIDRDGESITETFSLNGLAEVLQRLPCAAK